MPPPKNGNGPPIIIKRIKKVSGHGHHGGAWKVAYADFVTAMMAFFLLLWLLNATTEEQKRAISNYFAPASVSQTKSGAGGVLGGKTFAEGPMPSMGGAPGVVMAMPPPDVGDPENEWKDEEPAEGDPATSGDASTGKVAAKNAEIDRRKKAEAAAAEERRQFEEVARELQKAIQETPELRDLRESLMVDQTSEGLRIQIVDQEKVAMFPLGSARMESHARALLEKIVAAVAALPQQVAVTGYTDAHKFQSDNKGYGNWELSSDRANASRRALVELGLAPQRITRVVGRADTDMLLPNEPLSPRNRRISITLLRQVPQAGRVIR